MNFTNVKTADEIDKLVLLASEIWHDYWVIILSDEQIEYMLEKFQSKNAIQIQLKEENYIYNILEDNGYSIGYFGVSLKENYLFLSKLYIKKEFRGSGCGKFAFNKIKQIAKQYRKNIIRLTVNKHNLNTINVYEKWGFIKVDSVVTDIGNGFVMDDYIMEYYLKEN